MSEKPKSFFGNNPNYNGISQDNSGIDSVTELKVVNESERIYQAFQESMVDSLTGCFNRRYLEKYKAERFDPNRDNNRVGFVYVDLNSLKKVNDQEGHDAGDKLLQYTASFLKSSARKRDEVIRLGGDEFVVICHNDENTENFEEAICTRMGEKLGARAARGFAYGCAVFNIDRDSSIDDTQKLADQRMYEDKRRQREAEQ